MIDARGRIEFEHFRYAFATDVSRSVHVPSSSFVLPPDSYIRKFLRSFFLFNSDSFPTGELGRCIIDGTRKRLVSNFGFNTVSRVRSLNILPFGRFFTNIVWTVPFVSRRLGERRNTKRPKIVTARGQLLRFRTSVFVNIYRAKLSQTAETRNASVFVSD